MKKLAELELLPALALGRGEGRPGRCLSPSSDHVDRDVVEASDSFLSPCTPDLKGSTEVVVIGRVAWL